MEQVLIGLLSAELLYRGTLPRIRWNSPGRAVAEHYTGLYVVPISSVYGEEVISAASSGERPQVAT
jgi:hypothetical protein